MGAGCYYTNSLTNDKAAWIDIRELVSRDGDNENDISFNFGLVLQEISEVLEKCGYDPTFGDQYLFTNGLFKLELKLNYDETGLILYFDAAHPEYGYYSGQPDPRYVLAKANLHRTENKVWRELSKEGYTICVADTGYTCKEVKFN